MYFIVCDICLQASKFVYMSLRKPLGMFCFTVAIAMTSLGDRYFWEHHVCMQWEATETSQKVIKLSPPTLPLLASYYLYACIYFWGAWVSLCRLCGPGCSFPVESSIYCDNEETFQMSLQHSGSGCLELAALGPCNETFGNEDKGPHEDSMQHSSALPVG